LAGNRVDDELGAYVVAQHSGNLRGRSCLLVVEGCVVGQAVVVAFTGLHDVNGSLLLLGERTNETAGACRTHGLGNCMGGGLVCYAGSSSCAHGVLQVLGRGVNVFSQNAGKRAYGFVAPVHNGARRGTEQCFTAHAMGFIGGHQRAGSTGNAAAGALLVAVKRTFHLVFQCAPAYACAVGAVGALFDGADDVAGAH
jgi:hypothetical protein